MCLLLSSVFVVVVVVVLFSSLSLESSLGEVLCCLEGAFHERLEGSQPGVNLGDLRRVL